MLLRTLVLAMVLAGAVCSWSGPVAGPLHVPFRFPDDAVAYANELASDYRLDPVTGRMAHQRRRPKPKYTLHCVVVARTARQFYEHARFAPDEPKASHATYRHLVHLVLARSPRTSSAEGEKIIIPGYANLREFSMAYERLLKEESGGAWQSYVQRGNWRMVFPFTKGHQQRTATRLMQKLTEQRPPVVHLVTFPAQTLNHVLVLFGFEDRGQEVAFQAYDPNHPCEPAVLSYDRALRRFTFPANDYFPGGPVSVYEIYCAPWL